MLGNKYVAAAVGVLFILVLAYNLNFFRAKNRQNEVTAEKGPESALQHGPVRINPPERIVELEDKSAWKRDPFSLRILLPKKPEPKVPGKPDISEGIHLMGIIKRHEKSHALINGKVYGVNDKIGDAVITEINKNGIILSAGGESKRISFEDYIILKEKSK